MISDRDIELFILKNAVITQSLRSAFAAQGVGNTRGALEAQADSLVADYIRQMDFENVTNAARMSEFYKLFYALENDMRELIESAMVEVKGEDWWKIAVPQIVRDNVQKNYDREASEGLPPRSDRMIDYTTFGELGEIVKENWEVFSGMFSNATKNRVLRVINRLNMARGPIAHCNLLPEEEAIRLKLTIRDWYKLME
jgi:Swt1-like HEPN